MHKAMVSQATPFGIPHWVDNKSAKDVTRANQGAEWVGQVGVIAPQTEEMR